MLYYYNREGAWYLDVCRKVDGKWELVGRTVRVTKETPLLLLEVQHDTIPTLRKGYFLMGEDVVRLTFAYAKPIEPVELSMKTVERGT